MFPDCGKQIGFYPIVDRASWLERLLPTGVSTIQLRVKDLSGEQLHDEIKQAINIAEQYDCRLFINDYWQLALQLGAYGVHVGQSDLDHCDTDAIKKAGLRLGLSTHDPLEAKRALDLNPSYIAFGPIYHTTTKPDYYARGYERLQTCLASTKVPVVAIGGIELKHIDELLQMGVDGIAVIRAVTEAEDPQLACKQFLAKFQN